MLFQPLFLGLNFHLRNWMQPYTLTVAILLLVSLGPVDYHYNYHIQITTSDKYDGGCGHGGMERRGERREKRQGKEIVMRAQHVRRASSWPRAG
jgi:hypothetical protein